MRINYKFSSNEEPTDEQLHLLMEEVATDVKNKANITNKLFWEQLLQLVKITKERGLKLNAK